MFLLSNGAYILFIIRGLEEYLHSTAASLPLLLSSAFELECILHPKRGFTQLLYSYMVKCKVGPESSTPVSCFTSLAG